MTTDEQIATWLMETATAAVADFGETGASFREYVARALAHDAQLGRRVLAEVYPPAGPRRAEVFRQKTPRAVPVSQVDRGICVQIAAVESEWREAFELVARNYKAAGYEGSASCKVRFTPYHALPDSRTFVAKHENSVLMTMTLVADNRLLGLPLESIYRDEVRALRRQRRRMAEVISLAADERLRQREFPHVFRALIRLMKQYHVTHGGDTWLITVNPRHATFYTKGLGFEQLGPQRQYAAVQGHPALAYFLDCELMKKNAPKMYETIFGEWLPGDALVAPRMPIRLIRYLCEEASEETRQSAPRALFDYQNLFATPRRW